MADPFDPTYNSLLAQWLDPKSTPSALAQLRLSPPPQPSALALAAALSTPKPTSTGSSVLDALIACSPLPPSPFLGTLNPGPASSNSLLGSLVADYKKTELTRRRVFYSFHYDDIMRVNVVRRSGQFQPEDGVFDNSLWEKTKLQGDAALKRLINNGMVNSSVTCVLAGAQTWARPWVRYEIAASLARGNGLLVVYIDDVPCAHNRPATRGHNPFDQMAVGRIANGDARVFEHTAQGWTLYARLADPITWPRWLPETGNRTHVQPLGKYVDAYAYTNQGGSKQLSAWADRAALRAGKSS